MQNPGNRRSFSPIYLKTVITGFNTDIEYQGITYHVQTEDKGLNTPLILSLVYDKGTILASKRSPYDDLIAEGFNEKALSERLQKQHKLICAAVRAGRIEDLKRMTMKESALKQKGLIAQKEIKAAAEKREMIEPAPLPVAAQNGAGQFLKKEHHRPEKSFDHQPVPKPSAPIKDLKELPKIPKPKDELVWELPVKVLASEPIIEAVEIIEEEMILPAEAVEIVTDYAKTEHPVAAGDDHLKIELLNDVSFKGGERKTISIMVRRGEQEGLSGAHILVKIIGSSFRPLIFHARTDSQGVATIHLQLPHFRAGRAAILVKAMSEGEEVEMRRVITQG